MVVDVQSPEPGQKLTRRDYCSISKELAKWAGVGKGDQVRIYRTLADYALYTIVELRNEVSATIVRMKKSGRQRLGTSKLFIGQLDTRVALEGLTDAEARGQNELVERLVDDGDHVGLLVAAAHGGKIELNTDYQAEHLAALIPGVSSWICKGWNEPNGAHTRWHVRSEDLSPNSFTGLGAVANRGFKHVVSFHGMAKGGVIVGGLAPAELRQEVCDAIADAIADPWVPVTIAGNAGPYRGVDPGNFVNWLTVDGEGGIQIEQGPIARNIYWEAIAEAIASVLGPLI